MPGERLFTAIVPPVRALRSLALVVENLEDDYPELRWVPVERWHVTLGFFGDGDDPLRRRRWLRRRADGLPSPTLRMAGAGTFRDALWVGVEATDVDDHEAFVRLARACGADWRRFRAHLTVARWKRRAEVAGVAEAFADYAGPWFAPREVRLIRSDIDRSGPRYTTIAAVPLDRDHHAA